MSTDARLLSAYCVGLVLLVIAIFDKQHRDKLLFAVLIIMAMIAIGSDLFPYQPTLHQALVAQPATSLVAELHLPTSTPPAELGAADKKPAPSIPCNHQHHRKRES
jgi:disulfide bond formation protein DsbB